MDVQPFLPALFPWFSKGKSRLGSSAEEKPEIWVAAEPNGGVTPSLSESHPFLSILELNKLHVKIRFATFSGETVYLVLVNPLEEEDLHNLAAYLAMWWRNDYCRIYFLLDRRLETPGLRAILAGCAVELVLAESGIDASA